MANVIRILRSLTDGTRPTAKTEGELYVNFANKSLGVVDDAAVAQDLVAVRFFSDLSTYAVGDHVVNVDTLYKCSTAVAVPGPFDVTDWEEIGAAGAPPAETDPLALHLTGGVMTGPIELAADAAAPLEAVPLQQLEAEITALETAAAAAGLLYLPLTAGATKPLTGPLSPRRQRANVARACDRQAVRRYHRPRPASADQRAGLEPDLLRLDCGGYRCRRLHAGIGHDRWRAARQRLRLAQTNT